MGDIYFWRQLFVLFTSLLFSISIGFMLAFPGVLNPAIMSRNSTDIKTTGDHASWIAAVNGIGGLFGSFIHPLIMQTLGRKASHYSLNACLFTGWIIIPFAKSIGALYAARFIQGTSAGGVYINSILISEYVHPSRRGYFVTLKKVAIAFGVLCCHTMSSFWSWRQIASTAAVPPFVSIILTLFWPESPSHLALKGRFSECEASFNWLNGNSQESQLHLESMVKPLREKSERKRKDNFMEFLKIFLKKDFQKTFLISSVLTLSIDLCGRIYIMAYIIQIMTELLGNQSSAIYFSIGADLLALTALSLSTVVISYAKRRTILFTSGILAVLLMLVISALAYLKTFYTFSNYFLWFIAFILILQCFIVNIGIVPVSFTIVGEIFPLEQKGLGAGTSCAIFTILYSASLKVTPVLMEYTGLYGTYAIYSVVLAICLAILYKTVPETKDRTLQEIEDEMTISNQEIMIKERERLLQLKEMKLNA